MVLKSVPSILAGSLLFLVPYVWAGIDSGGGDLSALERFSSIQPGQESARDYYRSWFVAAASAGIEELEPLAWLGTAFKDAQGKDHFLKIEQLRAARKMVWELNASSDSKAFMLDDRLKNKKTHEPRMAQNAKGPKFWLNPTEWGRALDEKYAPEEAGRIRIATATHEFLSQQGLESTGDFTFSSMLLHKEALAENQEKYKHLLNSLFGSIDPSEYYSCDASLYHIENGQKVPVWRSPIPLKTYIRVSEGPGHMDEIDGKPAIPNPNFVIGTTSTCLTNVLNTVGYSKPYMVSKEVLKFLYRAPETGLFFDICYVMGDAGPGRGYEGGGRFVLREINEKDPFFKIHYVTPEVHVDGRSKTTIEYKNYNLDLSCGRVAEPIEDERQ